MLSGKKILIGVTGSIAAYKTAELIRLFIKANASVKVIMTTVAKDFITPLTLSVLSKNPVASDFISPEKEWNSHVNLGLWADIFLIAPASANTIAKMANGICDNLLLATYLSSKCPVYVAPAMDLDMYKHSTTQKNLHTLSSFGNKIIAPAKGELASGLVGEGRMEEPANIFKFLEEDICKNAPLRKKKAVVTAGPTYESIDPVRFIGNHSSGKMGFAIAEELASQGAEVTLISGPTSLNIHHPNIKRVDVISAEQMYDASLKYFSSVDIFIMSAAVADFKPKANEKLKIKKLEQSGNLDKSGEKGIISIALSPTKDILAELGKRKKKTQILVGFALETNNETANAKAKLKNKNLDFIVLNSLQDTGAGFQHDTNKITILDKNNNEEHFELKHKSEVAKDIVSKIISLSN